MKIQISKSLDIADSKEKAAKITRYELTSLDLEDRDQLEAFFQNYNYSGTEFDGSRSGNNFRRLHAIILDVDQHFSLDEAKEFFKDYIYIIHTSTSHQQYVASKGGVQDRYRVILPLDDASKNRITVINQFDALKTTLVSKFPFMDPGAFEASRQFFPYFTTPGQRNLFEIFVNTDGKMFHLNSTDIVNEVDSALGHHSRSYKLTPGMEFKRADGKGGATIDDVTIPGPGGKIPVYDTFCDDINSATPSAFLAMSKSGRKFLFCSHCKETRYLDMNSLHPNLLYLEDELYEVILHDGRVTLAKVNQKYQFTHFTNEDRDDFLTDIYKSRRYSRSNFTLQHEVNGYVDEISYDFTQSGLLVKIPPAPVIDKNNQIILDYVNSMFGNYSDFILDWMALYAYTNYKTLPIIVLTSKKRTAGKTTFASLLMSMYPDHSSLIKTLDRHFNTFYENKLLVIDEAEENRRAVYDEIKRVMGSPTITVERKFINPYSIKPNLSIVILSNKTTPLFFDKTEVDLTDTNSNQFFFLRLNPVKQVDNTLLEKFNNNIGWFVRTELRSRYEGWLNNDNSAYRYHIPTPITPELKEEFHESGGDLDDICDLVHDTLKAHSIQYDEYTLVQYKDVLTIMKENSLQYRLSAKSIIARMQDLGYLSKKTSNKFGVRGYKLIR